MKNAKKVSVGEKVNTIAMDNYKKIIYNETTYRIPLTCLKNIIEVCLYSYILYSLYFLYSLYTFVVNIMQYVLKYVCIINIFY